jgi:hypothetical protein
MACGQEHIAQKKSLRPTTDAWESAAYAKGWVLRKHKLMRL